MPRFLHVDPRTLLLTSGRRTGADPTKLLFQKSRFGASDVGMKPPIVYEAPSGELVLYDGVTRAARIAELAPGRPLLVEHAGPTRLPRGPHVRLGDTLP